LLLFLLLYNPITYGQEQEVRYYPATYFDIQGQAPEISSEPYSRIDSLNRAKVSKPLQILSRHTAGLYIEFRTNSSFIDVKWELQAYTVLSNMTPLAVNGLDLYGWKNSKWQYVNSGKAMAAQNKVRIIKNMDASMTRFRLYFPLYSIVKELSIGVDSKAVIHPVEPVTKHRVVIYGSSIT